MTSDVSVVRDGTTARVTLDRPGARNALSRAVNLRLAEIAEELDGDPTVHAVVITGAGDKAFCAGADLKERRGVSAADSVPYVTAVNAAVNGWSAIRKPTIAAINGSAYGGGLELAMACDFRIVVKGAELGLTEVRLGIIPGAGGTQRLPRLVGEARAKEMILLGQKISAARALDIGLVHRVVSATDFAAAIQTLLTELRASAPLSYQAAKTAIEQGHGRTLEDGLAIERTQYTVALNSDDWAEGLAAFAERRVPRFNGR